MLSWFFAEYGEIMENIKKIQELGNIFKTSSFCECIYRKSGTISYSINLSGIQQSNLFCSKMLSKSLLVLWRGIVVAMCLLCPSVRPGSWESVPEEQPVVEATEVVKEAGFEIDDARHRVYFASRGKLAGSISKIST